MSKGKPSGHGKNWIYLTGCRCDACRDAHRIYERNRQRSIRRQNYGLEFHEPFFVDATEVIKHLHFLRSKNLGTQAIADSANINRETVKKLISGKQRFVTRRVENKILGVSAYPSKKGHYVDTKEVKRLVDELVAHGHSKRQIAMAIGRKELILKNKTVRLMTLEAIKRVHKQWIPSKD